MKKTFSFFDDILKLVALASIILVIAGFIDLKTFYSKFGISINEYISTSEILMASIDKLGIVLFSLLIQCILWLYLFDYLFDYDLQESTMDGEPRARLFHDETLHRLVKNKKIQIFWILITGGAIIGLILSLIFAASKELQFLKDFFLINYWIGMCLYLAWIQGTKGLWEMLKLKSDYNAKVVVTFPSSQGQTSI